MASEKRLIDVRDCPCDGCQVKPCGHPARCVKFALWLNKTVDGVTILPCKIGDSVWAALTYYGKPCIRRCVVTEMAYLVDMTLAIAVRSATKNSQRVYWGVNAFSTFEECVAAVGGRGDG